MISSVTVPIAARPESPVVIKCVREGGEYRYAEFEFEGYVLRAGVLSAVKYRRRRL